MKVSKLLSVLLLGACASCSQDVIYDSESEINNTLIKNWIKSFGLIDSKHNWNMATLVKAEVDPNAFGENVTVRVYENNNNVGNRLIGIADQKMTLNLDVVRGTENVYAVIMKGNNKISDGVYPIQDGKVAINKPSAYKSPVRSRASGDSTPYFDWTIACEDLGTSDDFDFNDIVFGVNHVAGTKKVKITALACGGTLAADIYVHGKKVGEIHDLVKSGSQTTQMINTKSWQGMGTSVEIEVDQDWNMSTDMGDITIQVAGRPETVHAPATGTAPQMICIKGDWQWPSERTHILDAYPNFDDYNKDSENLSWLDGEKPAETIQWIEDVEKNNPSVVIVAKANNSKKMIDANGADWSVNFSTNTEINSKGKIWDYVPGLVTKAMLAYCEQYNDFDESAGSVYYNCTQYAIKGFSGSTLADGTFVEGSLDNIASGKVLLSLYRKTKDPKYKNAAKTMYTYLTESHPKTTEGGFFHKSGEYPNQMWLDGLYMGAAFMAEYVASVPDEFPTTESINAAWDVIYNQFNIIHSHTYNSQLQLNYHAWSETPEEEKSFWAKKDGDGDTNHYRNTGCSPEFWGRGMGWYIAALADVLEYMPRNNDHFGDLATIFKNVAKGVKDCQDKTSWAWYQLLQYKDNIQGLKWDGREYKNGSFNAKYNWYNGVDTGSEYVTFGYTISGGHTNYLEASASCMFTYALLKGLRLGLLSESEYRQCADKAYEDGIMKHFIRTAPGSYTGRNYDGTVEFTLTKDFNIVNICKSAGLAGLDNAGKSNESVKHYRDGSINYYLNGKDAADVVANEGKGIGPFIFASLEYELAHPVAQ